MKHSKKLSLNEMKNDIIDEAKNEWIDEFRRQVPLRKLCLVDEWNQTHELFQIIAIEEAKHESINLRRQVPMQKVMLRRRKKPIKSIA